MMLPLLTLTLIAAAQDPTAATLTLEQAIAEAQANAPVAARADARFEAAQARSAQARAQNRPTVTATGTIGYGRLDPGGFFGLMADDVTPRAAQVTIEQPLFTSGRVGAGIEQARAGEAAAQSAREQTRAMLAADVAEAYGAVLIAQERKRLYEQLVAVTERIARNALDRYEVGDAPRTDVSQANARLAEARAGLAGAEGQIRVTRARLASLIGRDPGRLASLPPPPQTPATLEDAITIARENSPMIAQAEAGVDAARAAERGAKAERGPTIGAYAEASTTRDQFFPGYRGDQATVGVRARWTLFDSGRTGGAIAEASAEVRAAEAQLAQARAQVDEAVTAGFSAVRTAALVETARRDQAAAATEAAGNMRDEVLVGQKPQLDLLNAEREAIAARLSVLEAQSNRVVAGYRLLALIGRE
ncbi:TolC family protein [Stakelama tenebrarum]|uniref:TolC family protein n=1 Tax=Stakelama tenebrarum TaxID=2711215 RepID=A0A6G6Y4N7_9SPHN|nr:TolC family protein [Sphingosinithalassobacter tenebrarum]QIG79859.1 TolC family protein [Sphingosinithalassobacter tenebrarum]